MTETNREELRLHVEDADTARLVGGIQADEPGRFEELYVRYFDRVYSYLRIALRDADEAEAATQDAFILAADALRSYEPGGVPFRVWLLRIAHDAAGARLREARRSEPASRPAAGSVERIEDRRLLTWVGDLPPDHRQVIVLRYMLTLQYGEIATVLRCSPDAARRLHRQAIRLLRERALGAPPHRGDHVLARAGGR
jgi:RNA polymerase sigma-70 factor (ECF subfamily)